MCACVWYLGLPGHGEGVGQVELDPEDLLALGHLVGVVGGEQDAPHGRGRHHVPRRVLPLAAEVVPEVSVVFEDGALLDGVDGVDDFL